MHFHKSGWVSLNKTRWNSVCNSITMGIPSVFIKQKHFIPEKMYEKLKKMKKTQCEILDNNLNSYRASMK